MAAFFDTLPFHVKLSVLPKYQNEIVDWCQNLFRMRCDALLYATHQSEAFLCVIRYALKLAHSGMSNATKKAIVYVSIDFDPRIKSDVLAALSNIHFEHCQNDPIFEDMVDANQLDQLVKRDVNDALSYPLMVVANAGKFDLRLIEDSNSHLCRMFQVLIYSAVAMSWLSSSSSAIKTTFGYMSQVCASTRSSPSSRTIL